MADYTPTTRKVRDDYITRWGYAPVARAEFDRWLAAHDAQVLRDAADALMEDGWLEAEEARMAHAHLTERAQRTEEGYGDV